MINLIIYSLFALPIVAMLYGLMFVLTAKNYPTFTDDV